MGQRPGQSSEQKVPFEVICLTQAVLHDGYDSAIGEYTKALAAEMDEYQVAYLNRGMAHEILGHLEAAEADYRRALELAPEWGLAISKLARVLVKQN